LKRTKQTQSVIVEEPLTPSQVEDEKKESAIDAAEPKTEQTEAALVDFAETESIISDEEAIVEASEDSSPAEETLNVEELNSSDDTLYVENFGLVSTAEDQHLEQVVAKGGVLFREKRSFMLTLALDDEIIALGKTTKLEEFPEVIQAHLKNDGFVKVDVVNFGEITKRRRGRYLDVTFKNLHALPSDHWIVKNVTELLEKGVSPKKDEEPETETPVTSEKPENETAAENKEDRKQDVFIIHPRFAQLFEERKEDVLKQQYAMEYKGGVVKLITKTGDKAVVISVTKGSSQPDGAFPIVLSDYQVHKKDEKTLVVFDFHKKDQPKVEPPAVEKPNVEIVSKSKLPEDFPLTDEMTIKLYPKAATMFDPVAAKSMIDDSISLAIHEGNNVSLVHNKFFMGKTEAALTKGSMEDSKWISRITAVVIDEVEDGKKLRIVIDRLEEVDTFPYENI